jgi:hypothetical protein
MPNTHFSVRLAAKKERKVKKYGLKSGPFLKTGICEYKEGAVKLFRKFHFQASLNDITCEGLKKIDQKVNDYMMNLSWGHCT